jgi:hypothetical protein
MPSASLRKLTWLSVAFFIAAACASCSSLYDTDKLDNKSKGGDAGEADAAGGDGVPDASDGGGDDGTDDGTGQPDAAVGPDAALEECTNEGQDCNEDDPFVECREGLCQECGHPNQPCCITTPSCEGLVGLLCTGGFCVL